MGRGVRVWRVLGVFPNRVDRRGVMKKGLVLDGALSGRGVVSLSGVIVIVSTSPLAVVWLSVVPSPPLISRRSLPALRLFLRVIRNSDDKTLCVDFIAWESIPAHSIEGLLGGQFVGVVDKSNFLTILISGESQGIKSIKLTEERFELLFIDILGELADIER